MLPTLSVPEFPFVAIADGVPAIMRAVADANITSLLTQAVGGSVPPILTQMLSGAVPSMLNGYAGAAYSTLLNQLQAPTPLSSDQASQESVATTPQWGIFNSDTGDQVVFPDSVVSFDWSQDYRVIKYPIEEGNFESYNKVKEPFEPRIIMRKGGSISDRQSFINTLESLLESLDTLTVTTPEKSYDSVTIARIEYPRAAQAGASVIEATITLQEINTTASSTFSNTAQPQGSDPTNVGTTNTQTPTAAQAAAGSGGAG